MFIIYPPTYTYPCRYEKKHVKIRLDDRFVCAIIVYLYCSCRNDIPVERIKKTKKKHEKNHANLCGWRTARIPVRRPTRSLLLRVGGGDGEKACERDGRTARETENDDEKRRTKRVYGGLETRPINMTRRYHLRERQAAAHEIFGLRARTQPAALIHINK